MGAEPVYLEGSGRKRSHSRFFEEGAGKGRSGNHHRGTSAGRYDVIKEALSIIGAQILFSRVAIKPGKSVIASHKDEKIILSLAGNPTAAMVTFDLVAVPAIKGCPVWKTLAAGGYRDPGRRLPQHQPRRRLLMARWKRQNGLGLIELAGKQGNVLKSSIDCNLLVDVPAGSPPLAAGQSVAAFVVGNLNDSLSEDE